MSTKTIRVFTSRGSQNTITTDATTWGELKPQIEEFYDLTNLQAAESVNKTSLIHKDAVLPDQDFVLFLRPVRTKAGGSIPSEGAIQALNKFSTKVNEALGDLISSLASLEVEEGEPESEFSEQDQDLLDEMMGGFDD